MQPSVHLGEKFTAAGNPGTEELIQEGRE